MNKVQKVDTRGIGNREVHSLQQIQQRQQQQQQQAPSEDRVYLMGIPDDFTEQDLDIMFCVCGKVKRIKIYKDEKDENKNNGDALITFGRSDRTPQVLSKYSRKLFAR